MKDYVFLSPHHHSVEPEHLPSGNYITRCYVDCPYNSRDEKGVAEGYCTFIEGKCLYEDADNKLTAEALTHVSRIDERYILTKDTE